jgi:hypothetical protein
VRSLVNAWPCSAPLQPLLPLPFPAPPLLVNFCAHLTFPSLAFLPHLALPPQIPICFLTALCPLVGKVLWHICCLDTGFERIPLVRLPLWRYRWKRLILFFPKSPKALQSDNLYFFAFHSSIIRKLIKSTYRQQNQLGTQDVFE